MAGKGIPNLVSGMYLLTTRDNQDYGCLINSAMEVSRNPSRVAVCLVKSNLTHEKLMKTGMFNLCGICADAPFDIYRRFGMKSGRTFDKFANFPDTERSQNGLIYLTRYCNMYVSAKVCEFVDLGDHTLFIGEIVEGAILSSMPTCTFDNFMKIGKDS